ncbi:unnamed protein product [Brassicogethes aeneus]|uniref:Uncharacterized protein n=1 Tax=Brassicogethes aeneus TaxID=1431903 RepID=A0A9P0BH43_BRAAE|nr:unnamed protein product [Brassicogethes aeneus]
MKYTLFLFVIIGGVISQDVDVSGISLGQDEMDVDIWSDAEKIYTITVDNIDDEIIDKICKNNNIIIQDRLSNEKIDCRQRRWNLEPLEVKNIKKRNVDSEQEGSGVDPHEEKAPDEAKITTTKVETEEQKDDTNTSTPTIIVSKAEEIQTSTAAIVTEKPTTTEIENSPTTISETEKPLQTISETEKPLLTTSETEKPAPTINDITTEGKDKEFNGFIKKGRKIEDMNDYQGNGVAISETHGNIEDGFKETGPKLLKTSKPENILQETENTPKVGAASAAKDSNILFFLLGGVVLVGVTAFTYNYVKKRKLNQPSSEATVEAPKERREQEMKPLLNGKTVDDLPTTPTIAIKDETTNEEPGTSANAKC